MQGEQFDNVLNPEIWKARKYPWTSVEDAHNFRRQLDGTPRDGPRMEWWTAADFDEYLIQLPYIDPNFARELVSLMATDEILHMRHEAAYMTAEMFDVDREFGTTLALKCFEDEDRSVALSAWSALRDAVEEGHLSADDVAPLLHEFELSEQRRAVRFRRSRFEVIEGEGQASS